MSRAVFPASLLSFLLLAAPASAQDNQDKDVCHSSAQLLEEVKAGLGKGGLAALAPLAPSMQQAVAGADSCFPSISNADGSMLMLADGTTETLMAAGSMATKKIKGTVLFNPFPQIAFVLGSYYNETGKPQDALRTLDKGLSLSPFPDMRLGASVHVLIAEKGAAFNALRRFDDALQDYDEGLKLANLGDADRARFHRGRGFALTELGRLDEAENAYRDALKLVPGDTRSQHELAYIARLRGGAAKADSYFSTAAPPSADKDVPQEQRAKKTDAPN